MDRNDFYKSWSDLHGNAEIVGIVKIWLTISYFVAKVFQQLRISPNLITISGFVFSVLFYLNAQSVWAPALLVLSLFADGIDGSMAIISGKSSKWGALLDSTVDRISEIFWVLALYKIGINFGILIAIITLASIQEYIRARSSGLGLSKIGIVTIAERPVRASFIFITLIIFHLEIGFIFVPIYIWLIFQLISVVMLLSFTKTKLN